MAEFRPGILASLLAFSLATSSVRAEDYFGCAATLRNDRTLLEALPERIRNILRADRTARWIPARETAWQPFFAAMDYGFANPGKFVSARIDDLYVEMTFRRGRDGGLQLWIDYLRRDGLNIGENSVNGLRFLDLIAAQMSWFAKRRRELRLPDFEILGEGLRNARLVEFLKANGFKYRGKNLGRCAAFGGIGGGFVGGVFGMIVVDRDREAKGATVGAGIGAVALTAGFCTWLQGGNFGLKVELFR